MATRKVNFDSGNFCYVLRYLLFCPEKTATVYAYKSLTLLIILESRYFPSFITRIIS
jgi:hypothetical protein